MSMYNTNRVTETNFDLNPTSLPISYPGDGEIEAMNESNAIAPSHLVELSDIQQEQVSGGCSCTAGGGGGDGLGFLFFQDTSIDTFGENHTEISSGEGGISGSNSIRTGYKFRQTTLAIGGLGSDGNSLASFFSLFKGLFG